MKKTTTAMVGMMVLCACSKSPEPVKPPEKIAKQSFGKTADGQNVERYTLRNSKGMEVSIITLGGIITNIKTADKSGKMGDVVAGFDTLPGYLREHPYFGALIGRYGNRIANARFTLGGKEYTLAANNGANSLHGGKKGFDKVIWQAKADASTAEPSLELQYTSKDGEEGFPGELKATVRYTLTESNELAIDYSATSDKDTVVNLTNHSYFNLTGEPGNNILNHELTIFANRYTPVDRGLIPTGKIDDVEDTPFDFTSPRAIGSHINDDFEQLRHGLGYDHNYVLNSGGGTLAPAAKVREPQSGRVMEVLTTEPGLQFYTGNFLDGTQLGKGGLPYKKQSHFCLETQHFPDSPNKPQFPPVVLKAGGRYQSKTVFRFTAQ